jgi:hypothetical protein
VSHRRRIHGFSPVLDLRVAKPMPPGDPLIAVTVTGPRLDAQAHRGMARRRRAPAEGTNLVWPAASRVFHPSAGAPSSASLSSYGVAADSRPAGSLPPAPRLRPGRPGESSRL